MKKIKELARKYLAITRIIVMLIVTVLVVIPLAFVEVKFNLGMGEVLIGMIIGFAVVVVDFVVVAKLKGQNKGGEEKVAKVSRLSLLPTIIPGIGLLVVAAVSTLWILNLGAEWSVVRLGSGAWVVSLALKFVWSFLTQKPLFRFLERKLPAKLAGPVSWSYLGFLTGVFECGAALVFVLKFDILYQATWVDMLAFGIGFGAFEVFVLGVALLVQIGQYILRPESIPEENREEDKWTPSNISMLFLPPVEKAAVLCTHVFSGVLIILAVQQNIYLFFGLAFGFRSLVDGIAAWMRLEKDIGSSREASLWWRYQSIYIALAFISLLGIMFLQALPKS